jgi:hypothetical protein
VTAVSCAAVLCDGTGRVLQYKDPIRRMWRFPTAVPGPEALRETAASALAGIVGVTASGGDGGDADDGPIDVDRQGDEVVLYYVFDLPASPLQPTGSTRWAPFDTVLNERLGTKLAVRQERALHP